MSEPDNQSSPDYDHEDLSLLSAVGTFNFLNDLNEKPDTRRSLSVTCTSVASGDDKHEYEVEIDFTNYAATAPNGQPVFSLYNLGLQSWRHKVAILGVTYYNPTDGTPIPTPQNPAVFTNDLSDANSWKPAPLEIPATGRTMHEPSGKPPQSHGPIEENIYFMKSPVHKRLKFQVLAMDRKLMGKPIHRYNSGKQTSHSNVPPNLPPSSSDDR